MKVIRWQTPWPLIQISEVEWVVMRDHPARPVALVRHLDQKQDDSYRVVRWAPQSADRRLFEYFPSLEMADMAVTFMEAEPDTGRQALTTERSPEWARFERWYWLNASDRLLTDYLPAWAVRDRLVRRPALRGMP